MRPQSLPAQLVSRLEGGRRAPVVCVSLGSFLSVRQDVVDVVVAGLRSMGLRGVVATGSAEPSGWDVPDDWIVARHLPQVAVLDRVDAVVCHAGSNT
ncbi:MAG: glycosyltransferase, partial [Acidimicrobiales bacterium]